MMIKEYKLTGRKKLLGAVIICALTITGLTMWHTRPVAEAALIEPYYEGLVGSWRFDEGTGSIAKDSSGNGNDGTIYGASWVDGKYGKALRFDGVDDYVEVPHSTDFEIAANNELSVELWINVTTFNLGSRPINKGSEWMFYPLDSSSKGIRVMTYADGAWKWGGPYALTAGLWYHVVATWNFTGTTLTTKLHINGNLEKTSEFAVTNLYTDSQPLRMGYQWANYFSGVIDEVRIYNRTLSAAEIQGIFQMPDFSTKVLAKIPKGTTQVIMTASWQGTGSLNATIESPSESYTEDVVPVYQKASYSTSDGTSEMLNIKRLSISIQELSSDENWYITLDVDDVKDYRITVEIQK